MKSVELASLLCSRLCHDLLSPVGALNNGIELLGDEQDPEMRARCLELLSESAKTTASKLKFFRLAFGASSGFGEVVEIGEAKSVVDGLFGAESKIRVNWLVDEFVMSKSALKTLLNLTLIAGDALVRGGSLTLGVERSGQGVEIVVRAEGARIAFDPEIKKALLGQSDAQPAAPRTVAAWLIRGLVEESGGQILVADEDQGVLVFGASLTC